MSLVSRRRISIRSFHSWVTYVWIHLLTGFPLSSQNHFLFMEEEKTIKTTNNNILLKVYSMDGKKQKLFEAKEKSDMFMRQVLISAYCKGKLRIPCLNQKTIHIFTKNTPNNQNRHYQTCSCARSSWSLSQHTEKRGTKNFLLKPTKNTQSKQKQPKQPKQTLPDMSFPKPNQNRPHVMK